jgi:hypothetical protein
VQNRSVARVVYLHVGAPKTGTTYLQDRLARNRASLAVHDVHYPLGVTGSMFEAAIDLIDTSGRGERENARGEWESLMARVRRSSGTLVVSHEILAAATPAQVERAMAGLEGAEVHVVYSARDLARQLPAEWQEGVKHRNRRSFARFLRTVQAAPRRGSRMWFWRVQALPDVLDRWSHGLPPSHVHLVTVPQHGAARDELWLRYCRALEIDPAWAPEESVRENVSIGIAETTLIRRLNRRLQASDSLDYASYVRLVRELVVHQSLAHRPDMVRATLPPAAYDWAEEVAEEWIEWVESAGIDVVGDLGDLRPVRPDDAAQWANPDRPGANAMLDAALDMIEVLLVQAASTKREPLVDQARKLARFARRIRHP